MKQPSELKHRHELRRRKLPPMLEIDENGVPVSELETWFRPRWTSDEDEPAMELGDWPVDFDD